MMGEPSHQKVLVICKAADGEQKSVHIKINANNLVVCPEWKTCPSHGSPECQAKQMHEEILKKIRKEKRYKKKRKKTRG